MEIYLDNAATSQYEEKDDIIVDVITRTMKKYWNNPSSLYATNVKEKIDKCRTNIAKFIGAKSDEIYFTSGSSESNSWAIKGWDDCNIECDSCIITTPIEHKSILMAIENPDLTSFAYYCDVDKYGMVDLYSLECLLSDRTKQAVLVSICMANNEIGTLQDIKKISNLVHKYNGILHVDATQAFGHIPINVDNLGIDMLSASGHKISPVLRGIGFLYKKNGINIKPIIYGTQEMGLRGGTENTYGIIGLSKAVEYCDISLENIEEMIEKRDYLINKLESKFGCKLNGHNEYRLPNNINITFPQNITGEALLYTLEMSNVFISTGSACNSKLIEKSHVLKSIGLSNDEMLRTIRISLPNDITYNQIDKVILELEKAIRIIGVGVI